VTNVENRDRPIDIQVNLFLLVLLKQKKTNMVQWILRTVCPLLWRLRDDKIYCFRGYVPI